MGVVYKALERGLNRLVAIKVIGDLAGLSRFRTEAPAIARLQHPNIVPIYKQRSRPRHGPPYFSMELVEGGSLARQFCGKPWPATRAALLVRTLARAVHPARV